ncbi:MAG: 4-phosphoerythronate dehydrogenase [Paludibacteraceae bacterium]|nr:4-phosphoerythronate dehydrogenase [Paludibacteraceae bacterium]
MRILIDKYIPFLQGVLDNLAQVCYIEPEQFTPEAVRDADALIVRTRTQCNRLLLDGSRVQFIATATIGTDHIDLDYCRMRNIRVVSCPGCNAQAVCDYVEEALNEVAARQLSIGIVGVGHVGSLVAKMAERRGMRVVLNDPPRGMTGDVTGCDVITFHTPLTRNGTYPTYHLCDGNFLSRCQPDALIINAARGGVVDEQALLDSTQRFVIDTWEGEPNISSKVLDRALLASFHIAGYSVQGKRNASQTCMDALSQHFNLPKLNISSECITAGDSRKGWLKRVSDQLKANPAAFEQLRKQYALR